MQSPSRVGYVLKRYPRLSETFVVQEILGREAAGEQIAIASLRQAGDTRFHASIAAVRAPVTWIPELHGHADRLWESLTAAEHHLPRLRAVLPELLAMPAPDAAQAINVELWTLRTHVTHLHAHFATMAASVARAASLLTGIPYSFTAHAKDIFHRDVDPLALAAKLRDAHHVVTVSEYNAAWLRERFGADAERVHRVYNGLDLDGARWHDPRHRAPGVVFVGRLVEKKGVPDLVDAVAVLRDRGVPLPLQLVGAGPLESALREQVRRLDLDHLVRFHGPLPQGEVAELIARAVVFAAPCVHAADGDRDGLPTVLLEAMAMGTPCVSTPVTGIPSRTTSPVCSSPSGTPTHWPTSSRCWSPTRPDPALRLRLAAAARCRVEEAFDRCTQAAELARLCAGHPAVEAVPA